MAYVDANGERPGYAALDSAATIIATVKNGLIAAGHDAALVDDAFENGLPPQQFDADTPEEDLRYNGLARMAITPHLYGLQSDIETIFQRAH